MVVGDQFQHPVTGTFQHDVTHVITGLTVARQLQTVPLFSIAPAFALAEWWALRPSYCPHCSTSDRWSYDEENNMSGYRCPSCDHFLHQARPVGPLPMFSSDDLSKQDATVASIRACAISFYSVVARAPELTSSSDMSQFCIPVSALPDALAATSLLQQVLGVADISTENDIRIGTLLRTIYISLLIFSPCRFVPWNLFVEWCAAATEGAPTSPATDGAPTPRHRSGGNVPSSASFPVGGGQCAFRRDVSPTMSLDSYRRSGEVCRALFAITTPSPDWSAVFSFAARTITPDLRSNSVCRSPSFSHSLVFGVEVNLLVAGLELLSTQWNRRAELGTAAGEFGNAGRMLLRNLPLWSAVMCVTRLAPPDVVAGALILLRVLAAEAYDARCGGHLQRNPVPLSVLRTRSIDDHSTDSERSLRDDSAASDPLLALPPRLQALLRLSSRGSHAVDCIAQVSSRLRVSYREFIGVAELLLEHDHATIGVAVSVAVMELLRQPVSLPVLSCLGTTLSGRIFGLPVLSHIVRAIVAEALVSAEVAPLLSRFIALQRSCSGHKSSSPVGCHCCNACEHRARNNLSWPDLSADASVPVAATTASIIAVVILKALLLTQRTVSPDTPSARVETHRSPQSSSGVQANASISPMLIIDVGHFGYRKSRRSTEHKCVSDCGACAVFRIFHDFGPNWSISLFDAASSPLLDAHVFFLHEFVRRNIPDDLQCRDASTSHDRLAARSRHQNILTVKLRHGTMRIPRYSRLLHARRQQPRHSSTVCDASREAGMACGTVSPITSALWDEFVHNPPTVCPPFSSLEDLFPCSAPHFAPLERLRSGHDIPMLSIWTDNVSTGKVKARILERERMLSKWKTFSPPPATVHGFMVSLVYYRHPILGVPDLASGSDLLNDVQEATLNIAKCFVGFLVAYIRACPQFYFTFFDPPVDAAASPSSLERMDRPMPQDDGILRAIFLKFPELSNMQRWQSTSTSLCKDVTQANCIRLRDVLNRLVAVAEADLDVVMNSLRVSQQYGLLKYSMHLRHLGDLRIGCGLFSRISANGFRCDDHVASVMQYLKRVRVSAAAAHVVSSKISVEASKLRFSHVKNRAVLYTCSSKKSAEPETSSYNTAQLSLLSLLDERPCGATLSDSEVLAAQAVLWTLMAAPTYRNCPIISMVGVSQGEVVSRLTAVACDERVFSSRIHPFTSYTEVHVHSKSEKPAIIPISSSPVVIRASFLARWRVSDRVARCVTSSECIVGILPRNAVLYQVALWNSFELSKHCQSSHRDGSHVQDRLKEKQVQVASDHTEEEAPVDACVPHNYAVCKNGNCDQDGLGSINSSECCPIWRSKSPEVDADTLLPTERQKELSVDELRQWVVKKLQLYALIIHTAKSEASNSAVTSIFDDTQLALPPWSRLLTSPPSDAVVPAKSLSDPSKLVMTPELPQKRKRASTSISGLDIPSPVFVPSKRERKSRSSTSEAKRTTL